MPYYDLVEDYVGISGQAENVPELPDSRFHPAMPMSCAETQLRTRVKSKLGWTVTIGRSANITKPLNGRGACHYCGPCEHGCVTHSYFNAAFTTVADALQVGQHDAHHQRDGLQGPDRSDDQQGDRRHVHRPRDARGEGSQGARGAALRAGARVRAHPPQLVADGGLANSSGVLGHYLMDHTWVAGGASGEFPDTPAPEAVARRARGARTASTAIRMKNTINGPRQKDYLRGFGFQGGGSTSFRMNAPGYGAGVQEGACSIR